MQAPLFRSGRVPERPGASTGPAAQRAEPAAPGRCPSAIRWWTAVSDPGIRLAAIRPARAGATPGPGPAGSPCAGDDPAPAVAPPGDTDGWTGTPRFPAPSGAGPGLRKRGRCNPANARAMSRAIRGIRPEPAPAGDGMSPMPRAGVPIHGRGPVHNHPPARGRARRKPPGQLPTRAAAGAAARSPGSTAGTGPGAGIRSAASGARCSDTEGRPATDGSCQDPHHRG